MKNLFERHRDRLTSEERDRIWAVVRNGLSRGTGRRSVPAGTTPRHGRSRSDWSGLRLFPVSWRMLAVPPSGRVPRWGGGLSLGAAIRALAIGALAVVALLLVVTRPWERRGTSAPVEPVSTQVIDTTGGAKVAELIPPQRQGMDGAHADSGFADRAVNPAEGEPRAGRQEEPDRIIVGHPETGAMAARTSPSVRQDGPAAAPVSRSAAASSPSEGFPPSIGVAQRDARTASTGEGVQTNSAAAGSSSRSAAVTPTETAPSPAAERQITERLPPGPSASPGPAESLAAGSGERSATDLMAMQQRALRQAEEAPAVTPERATPVLAGHGPGTISGRVTDEKDKPLAYANVVMVGTSWGAFTKSDGIFKIVNVPPGTYVLRTTMVGYEDQSVSEVRLLAGSTVTVNFKIKEKPTTIREVEITAARERIKTKSAQTGYTLNSDQAADVPPSDVTNLIALKAGVVASAGGLHIRGGRAGEAGYEVDGVPLSNPRAGAVAEPGPRVGVSYGWGISAAKAPDGTPRVPTTGGTTLPNDEVYDSMFFEHYGVNPFIPTDEDPLSTFAVDVDAASYTVMRRYLEGGHLPDKEAVRVEEFVNFFKQGYPRFDDTDFRIFIEGAPSPFGKGYQLLRVGIKAREISADNRKQANLVFVIDTSGSMDREDRLELVKRSLRVLVDELRPSDRIGIVVYGSNGRVLLEPISLGPSPSDDGHSPPWRDGWKNPPQIEEAPSAVRERILRAIDNLYPDGSTNAEEGLLLGYEMAGRMYRGDAINRVILCSDGVANVGQTGPESILNRVRGEAAKGIQITTIGFGMGNYNDVLMEQLADKGDGNYYYVDDLAEANRVLSENLTSTLQTIARDAKVQVEFDPSRVLRYRLLGFENRDVADRDFRNDKVDAGEIGAGHEVTALYEVKLAEGADRGRIATVRFRYARPELQRGGAPIVREIEQGFDVPGLFISFRDASPHFRLDAAVAEFAEILRHSFWAKESRIADVVPVARAAADDLPGDDAVREFVWLVERAVDLSDKLSPEEQRDVQGR